MSSELNKAYASEVIDALGEDPWLPSIGEELLSICCGDGPAEGSELDDTPYVEFGEAAIGICQGCKEHSEFTPAGAEYKLYSRV